MIYFKKYVIATIMSLPARTRFCDYPEEDKMTLKIKEIRSYDQNLNFEVVLPIIAKPWFSIGNVHTLQKIGKILDSLPAEGGDEPAWKAAQEISKIFHEYCKPGGGYTKEYDKHPSGYYAPGICEAYPYYSGRAGKWYFKMKLISTSDRSIEVFIGSSGNYSQSLRINFPEPSLDSAGYVEWALADLAVCNEKEEVEVADQYDFVDNLPEMNEKVYSPGAKKIGVVVAKYPGYVEVDVGEDMDYAETSPLRFR